MITATVITDGRRGCLTQTIESLNSKLTGPITRKVIYDDTGDGTQHSWLAAAFPDWELIYHAQGRQGFDGAIRFLWQWLRQYDDNPYVYSTEDDFILNRTVNLYTLFPVLMHRPWLKQLALRRQPWGPEERAVGGYLNIRPKEFTEVCDGFHVWIEHRRFWTTNPHLTRRDVIMDNDWPRGSNSEGRFTHQLISHSPDVRFGIWGSRGDNNLVTHIGDTRNGVGY